ncbi:hypothetical protein [Streptomyces violascens]|uniref:hypothetical protein n=1 Tax=Streptomyces violascens TaxID=67381 RepID=UPI003656453F
MTHDHFSRVAARCHRGGFFAGAFVSGRLAVRAVHRAPRWVYFAAPPIITIASGYGVVWLLFWPSYYASLFLLPWWGLAVFGMTTGWVWPGPRRGVRACLARVCRTGRGGGAVGSLSCPPARGRHRRRVSTPARRRLLPERLAPLVEGVTRLRPYTYLATPVAVIAVYELFTQGR